jgi:hypothetical protein
VQQEILELVTDLRYRAGMEKIEAAYRTLMKGKSRKAAKAGAGTQSLQLRLKCSTYADFEKTGT